MTFDELDCFYREDVNLQRAILGIRRSREEQNMFLIDSFMFKFSISISPLLHCYLKLQ